jgi:hypothetical protein
MLFENHFSRLLFIVSIFIHSIAYSQQLVNVNATLTQQETMLISWTMKAGSTCADLTLEHANESLSFSEIYYYPGVCGNADYDETYTFEQKERLYATNYYRIKLGVDLYSDTIKVEAPLLGSSGLKVGPQPANETINLFFSNPLSDSFSLIIRDMRGFELFFLNEIKENSIQIPVHSLPAGIYYLTLTSPYKHFQQRLLIQH